MPFTKIRSTHVPNLYDTMRNYTPATAYCSILNFRSIATALDLQTAVDCLDLQTAVDCLDLQTAVYCLDLQTAVDF